MKSGTLSALQISLRSGAAAGLAVVIAELLQLQHPIYALIAAVIVSDLSPLQTRQLALQRTAGTILGAALGATFVNFLPVNPLTIGFCILISMFITHILNFRGAAKLSGYLCGIVMLNHHGDSWTYAFLRLLETTVGLLVALGVSLIPKYLTDEKIHQLETQD